MPNNRSDDTSTRREFLASAAAGVAAAGMPGMSGAADEEIPILDLHQHTLYNGRPDTGLLAHQEQHRIRTTVILAGEGWMRSIIGLNQHCADFVKAHSDR